MEPADVVFEPNIVYGAGGGRELALDVLRPRDQGGAPPMLVVTARGTTSCRWRTAARWWRGCGRPAPTRG